MKEFRIEIKNDEYRVAVIEKMKDLGLNFYDNADSYRNSKVLGNIKGCRVVQDMRDDTRTDIELVTLDDLYEITICKFKMTNEEKRPEFEKVIKPVIEFLNNYYIPHTKIIIDCDSAEIVSGEMTMRATEFTKD